MAKRFSHVSQKLKAQGHHHIQVESPEPNKIAQLFYLNYGWQVATVKTDRTKGIKKVVFEKHL